MAKKLKFPAGWSAIAMSTLVVSALAGCQQHATVVEALSPPNLNAPDVSRPSAPMAVIPPLTPLAPLVPAAPRTLQGTPRDWIPVAAARPWRWIVVHHSDTPTGSAAVFDRMHREKGWDELGYHFVIGNGTQSGDGQVEVGPRWPIQKHGAHTKTPDNEYNDYGIGICLVGDFEHQHPTAAQMRSLAKLVAFLQERYRIPASGILRHRDCKPTLCPGANLSIALVRRMASQVLVDAGVEVPADTAVADASSSSAGDDAESQPTTRPAIAASAIDLLMDAPAAR